MLAIGRLMERACASLSRLAGPCAAPPTRPRVGHVIQLDRFPVTDVHGDHTINAARPWRRYVDCDFTGGRRAADQVRCGYEPLRRSGTCGFNGRSTNRCNTLSRARLDRGGHPALFTGPACAENLPHPGAQAGLEILRRMPHELSY